MLPVNPPSRGPGQKALGPPADAGARLRRFAPPSRPRGGSRTAHKVPARFPSTGGSRGDGRGSRLTACRKHERRSSRRPGVPRILTGSFRDPPPGVRRVCKRPGACAFCEERTRRFNPLLWVPSPPARLDHVYPPSGSARPSDGGERRGWKQAQGPSAAPAPRQSLR